MAGKRPSPKWSLRETKPTQASPVVPQRVARSVCQMPRRWSIASSTRSCKARMRTRNMQEGSSAQGSPAEAGRRIITATSVTKVSGTTKLIITPEKACSASCCCAARIR